GLNELPLEASLRAVVAEAALRRADARHGASLRAASERACAGRPRFLIVDTEVGVVRQKIELIAERGENSAGKISRDGQPQVVKRLEHRRERTVLLLRRRQVLFGTRQRRQLHSLSDDAIQGRSVGTGDLCGHGYFFAGFEPRWQNALHGDRISPYRDGTL